MYHAGPLTAVVVTVIPFPGNGWIVSNRRSATLIRISRGSAESGGAHVTGITTAAEHEVEESSSRTSAPLRLVFSEWSKTESSGPSGC